MSVDPHEDPIAILRQATRAEHDALETSSWLDEATAGIDAYGLHVARVAAFQRDAQRALDVHDSTLRAHGLASDQRAKVALIEAEAAALRARGVAVPRDAGAFPDPHTPSHALGCAYVLRGASLGGLVIARVVRDRLGWESAFYTGAGAGTAAAWRAFGDALRAAAAHLDRDALVYAARATFAAYGTRILA